MAFTLGHTVFGQTDAALDVTHDHERVHVRQFERWGPLMGPAYLGCSLVLWLAGRRPYRDNPFERQAFEQGGEFPRLPEHAGDHLIGFPNGTAVATFEEAAEGQTRAHAGSPDR